MRVDDDTVFDIEARTVVLRRMPGISQGFEVLHMHTSADEVAIDRRQT